MKYIECEAAIRDICEWATNLNNPKMLVREDVICILENIPAANVRPVVMCRDCAEAERSTIRGCVYCAEHGRAVPEDGWCSFGMKRRKADDTPGSRGV